MRFSRFCNVYEICDSSNTFWYLLRHSILNYSFLLSEKEFEELKTSMLSSKLSNEFSPLEKAHLIVPENYLEEKLIKHVLDNSKINRPLLDIFYLTFDTKCNLNCRYCYTEGSVDCTFEPQVMSADTLLKTFDFLEKMILKGKGDYVRDEISFIFYGSEPLLHPDLLELSLKKIEELTNRCGVKTESQLITNATLLTKKVADLLKRYDVQVAISLDGPKKLHDQMRIGHDGKGSYSSTMKGIEILNKMKIPFSISCTIGPHNFNQLSSCISFFKEVSAEGMGFNLLLDAKFKEIPKLSNLEANEALFNSFGDAEKAGFFESRVGRKLVPFNNPGKVHFRDCGAYGNQLVFFPNGDIGVCQGYLGYRKHLLGNVKTSSPKEVSNSTTLQDWVSRVPLNRLECRYCPAIGVCGGGCIFNSESSQGSIFKRNKTFCMHTMMSLDWLIRSSLERRLGKKVYFKEISFMF